MTECPVTECPATECPLTKYPVTECPATECQAAEGQATWCPSYQERQCPRQPSAAQHSEMFVLSVSGGQMVWRLVCLHKDGKEHEIGLETEIDANIIEEEKFYVSINISIKALFSIIFDHV